MTRPGQEETLTARAEQIAAELIQQANDLSFQMKPSRTMHDAAQAICDLLARVQALEVERDKAAAGRDAMIRRLDAEIERCDKAEAQVQALQAEVAQFRSAIDPRGALAGHQSLVALAEAHRQDSEDRDVVEAEIARLKGYVQHKTTCESQNRQRICPSCGSYEVVWLDKPAHGCDKCGKLFTLKRYDCTCGLLPSPEGEQP